MNLYQHIQNFINNLEAFHNLSKNCHIILYIVYIYYVSCMDNFWSLFVLDIIFYLHSDRFVMVFSAFQSVTVLLLYILYFILCVNLYCFSHL